MPPAKCSQQAQINAAKRDDRWKQAYDSSKNMTMPDDFRHALDANPTARDFFNTLSKTNTYAFLWRIQTAKKPESRQAFVQMLADGQAFHS